MLSKIFPLIKSWGSHFKDAFSENGRGSFSRYACGFILINATAWVWYMIFKTHALPDLTGMAMYVPASMGTLYGANQVKNVVGAWKGNPSPGVVQDTTVVEKTDITT
jgi:hypothetical protein